MQEYQTLTNRLERVKKYQRRCILSIDPLHSKKRNDYHYSRFCRACEVANELLSRMVNLILDKEGIEKVATIDLGKSFEKLKSTL